MRLHTFDIKTILKFFAQPSRVTTLKALEIGPNTARALKVETDGNVHLVVVLLHEHHDGLLS